MINLGVSVNLENSQGPSNQELNCDRECHLSEKEKTSRRSTNEKRGQRSRDLSKLTSPKYKIRSPRMSPRLKSTIKRTDKKNKKESIESNDKIIDKNSQTIKPRVLELMRRFEPENTVKITDRRVDTDVKKVENMNAF